MKSSSFRLTGFQVKTLNNLETSECVRDRSGPKSNQLTFGPFSSSQPLDCIISL